MLPIGKSKFPDFHLAFGELFFSTGLNFDSMSISLPMYKDHLPNETLSIRLQAKSSDLAKNYS